MTSSLGKENRPLNMSSVVTVKQVKVLCLSYVPSWWQKLSQLWMQTRSFHTCAKIHPDPCGVLEYFMIIHKYENSTGSSPLKEFFPTVNLCMAVIKYSLKIFGHLFYYFYQLCSRFRLLFHFYPFLQFDARFRSFGHLQDVPLAGQGSWKKWI